MPASSQIRVFCASDAPFFAQQPAAKFVAKPRPVRTESNVSVGGGMQPVEYVRRAFYVSGAREEAQQA